MQQLFGQKVLNDFIQKQDEKLIENRWQKYKNFLAKKEKISSWIETDYQDGFLEDIFENCLGYISKTRSTDEHYTLEREKKNETNAQKADGALLVDDKVVAVIELKDLKTKDLDKKYNREESAVRQAFGYLQYNNHAKYVIISNFNELRFYFDKATAYEQFFLFDLDYYGFKKLHTILSYESIKEGLPLKLKEKSANFEQQISKELYHDFSVFRNHLFENIVKNNFVIASETSAVVIASEARQSLNKSTLLRLTQKLCDRIIFILFAEDRGLLRHNTIKEIREEFKGQKFTSYALYDIYKFYFNAINEGNEKLGIPKYNGGLFAKDEILDSLIIDDEVLNMEAQKLSDYDFASEISVNILGHIFEQSLSDLEEIQANIDNTDFDKKQGKRKKDGVFYTPEYITRYIVENTLGRLCEEKKKELNILEALPAIETSFVIARSEATKQSSTKKRLPRTEVLAMTQYKENLLSYREWLTNLKILDPACGSGAFLNQALEFLIKEHTLVRDMLLPFEDLTLGYEIEKEILEHNLYGVDINEDAVEIAKLSLWLRTAHKGRELTSLAEKIVCANSLLEMPFEEGSFDVVIGNPPYVRQEMIKELKPALQERYETYAGTADLFVYFYELGYKMLKENATMGYICSNKFFAAQYGEKLRELILQKMSIEKISNFGDKKVFEDAVVTSDITIFQKKFSKENHLFDIVDVDLVDSYQMKQIDLNKNGFVFLPINELKLKSKIEQSGVSLRQWDISIKSGIKTGFNEAFIINEDKKNELIKLDPRNSEIIKPYLRGRDVSRYSYSFQNLWLLNIHNNPPVDVNKYPLIKKHLDTYYEKIVGRSDKGLTPYNLRNCAFLDDFEKEKIIWIELSDLGKFTLDTEKYYVDMTIFFITGESLKYLLAVLNSKLIFWYFNLICAESGVGTNRWKKVYVEQIPITKISEIEQEPFIKLVDEILEAKQKIKEYKVLFDEAVKTDNFDREIKLKKEIEILENRTKECEKTIDEMVYKLYDLSEDEIKIVEENK